jgi:hypothetical protein
VRRGRQRDHDAGAGHHPGRSTSPGRAARRSRGQVAAVERLDKHFRPELTIKRILELAEAHHAQTGDWPTAYSSWLPQDRELSWRRIDNALRLGLRGLPGRDSLAQLLARERGVRNVGDLSALTEKLILSWADQHKRRTGRWPTENAGSIADAPGEVWANVNAALMQGLRGLPGGSSLAVLIATHRGVRNLANIPPLTEAQILEWADRTHEETGKWPKVKSGAIRGAPGETWVAIDDALRCGLRGLPGGSSLAKLLLQRRGVRSIVSLPRLTLRDIRRWARAHRQRSGKWPTANSGPIPEATGENWRAVNLALYNGHRGLPGGSSLARLLKQSRRGTQGKSLSG